MRRDDVMTNIIKNSVKLIVFVGVGAFIGLMIGQFLSMPFLLFLRNDPGVQSVSGNPILGRISNFIYPFCAAIGFFVGAYIARRKKMEVSWVLVCSLFAMSILIFYPWSKVGYYDIAAYRNAVDSFWGYMLGGGIGMVSFFLQSHNHSSEKK
jgi:hypothetical protein